MEQAEIDSIGTWLGGEEENYTIVETDHMHGGVSILFQLVYIHIYNCHKNVCQVCIDFFKLLDARLLISLTM